MHNKQLIIVFQETKSLLGIFQTSGVQHAVFQTCHTWRPKHYAQTSSHFLIHKKSLRKDFLSFKHNVDVNDSVGELEYIDEDEDA